MAILDLKTEPGGQSLQRETGEIGLGDLGEQPGIERARAAERSTRALAFALEHSEIETERVPDQDRVPHKGEQVRPDLVEGGRVRDRRVVDMMHGDGPCR